MITWGKSASPFEGESCLSMYSTSMDDPKSDWSRYYDHRWRYVPSFKKLSWKEIKLESGNGFVPVPLPNTTAVYETTICPFIRRAYKKEAKYRLDLRYQRWQQWINPIMPWDVNFNRPAVHYTYNHLLKSEKIKKSVGYEQSGHILDRVKTFVTRLSKSIYFL